MSRLWTRITRTFGISLDLLHQPTENCFGFVIIDKISFFYNGCALLDGYYNLFATPDKAIFINQWQLRPFIVGSVFVHFSCKLVFLFSLVKNPEFQIEICWIKMKHVFPKITCWISVWSSSWWLACYFYREYCPQQIIPIKRDQSYRWYANRPFLVFINYAVLTFSPFNMWSRSIFRPTTSIAYLLLKEFVYLKNE